MCFIIYEHPVFLERISMLRGSKIFAVKRTFNTSAHQFPLLVLFDTLLSLRQMKIKINMHRKGVKPAVFLTKLYVFVSATFLVNGVME